MWVLIDAATTEEASFVLAIKVKQPTDTNL